MLLPTLKKSILYLLIVIGVFLVSKNMAFASNVITSPNGSTFDPSTGIFVFSSPDSCFYFTLSFDGSQCGGSSGQSLHDFVLTSSGHNMDSVGSWTGTFGFGTSSPNHYFDFNATGTNNTIEIVNGISLYCPVDPNITQICSFTPVSGSINASSSPLIFQTKIWLSLNDQQAKIKREDVYKSAGGVNGSIPRIINDYVVNNYGMNTFYSTTSTALNVGDWETTIILKTPLINLFGQYIYNPFIVNNRYNYQTQDWSVGFNGSFYNSKKDYYNALQQANASSTFATNTCTNLVGFFAYFQGCVNLFFVPDGNDLIIPFRDLGDALLHANPIGYGYRLYDLFSTSTATSTLPSLVLHLPSSSPLAGTSTVFNTDDIFASAINIENNQLVDENGNNVWTIIMPTLRIIIYLLFVVIILRELMKLDMNNNGVKDYKEVIRKR
jgi:hypothetical protein